MGKIAIAILSLVDEPEEKMIPIKLEAQKKLRAIIFRTEKRNFERLSADDLRKEDCIYIIKREPKKILKKILALSKVRFNGREVVR
jgi:hypothetical protein